MVDLATARDIDALTWEMDRRGMMPDFGWWLKKARSEWRWDYPHFVTMQKALDRVTAGELKRVVFSVAIRHGKSESNTISYPVYRLERDQSTRVLVVSHSERQAHKFSRQMRRLAQNRGIKMGERDTAGEWETGCGGGVIALGAGAGTASLSADLIVVDDPIGKREHAESEARREGLWDWLTNDVLSRVEPETGVIFTMSRWHTDDVAGRILEGRAGDWHVVDLPGAAEEDDALDRQPGEALWPEFRNDEWLEQKRVELGSYGFASLIQGRPRPREGGMFKWDWWQEIDVPPATGQFIRYWDTAGTADTGDNDPDYTAGALLTRLPDGRTAIIDIARFRESVATRDAKMQQIAMHDRAKYGGRVKWWIETESGVGGTERTVQLIRRIQNAGVVCKADPRPNVNKVLRAEPLASKAEAGNIVLCPGEWRNEFRLEAADFPGGRHDDQIDAVAGADAKLAVRTSAVVTTLRQ